MAVTEISVTPIDEVSLLRAEVQRLSDEVRQLRADLQDARVFTAVAKVNDLWEWNEDLDGKISKILHQPPKAGTKQEGRLTKLSLILVSRNNMAMSLSEVGKVLELGSRREGKSTRWQNTTHFRKVLEGRPDQYEIFPGKTQNRKMVRLTREYYNKLCKK